MTEQPDDTLDVPDLAEILESQAEAIDTLTWLLHESRLATDVMWTGMGGFQRYGVPWGELDKVIAGAHQAVENVKAHAQQAAAQQAAQRAPQLFVPGQGNRATRRQDIRAAIKLAQEQQRNGNH